MQDEAEALLPEAGPEAVNHKETRGGVPQEYLTLGEEEEGEEEGEEGEEGKDPRTDFQLSHLNRGQKLKSKRDCL